MMGASRRAAFALLDAALRGLLSKTGALGSLLLAAARAFSISSASGISIQIGYFSETS